MFVEGISVKRSLIIVIVVLCYAGCWVCIDIVVHLPYRVGTSGVVVLWGYLGVSYRQ